MIITSLSKQLSTAEVAAVAQVMSELYGSGQPAAKDAFLASLMTELNSLSVNLATAIDRRAEKSLLSESVSMLDASCRAFNSLLKHYVQSSNLTMKVIESPDNYTQFANNVVALIAKANSRVYANKKSDAETSGSEPANTEPQIGIAG